MELFLFHHRHQGLRALRIPHHHRIHCCLAALLRKMVRKDPPTHFIPHQYWQQPDSINWDVQAQPFSLKAISKVEVLPKALSIFFWESSSELTIMQAFLLVF